MPHSPMFKHCDGRLLKGFSYLGIANHMKSLFKSIAGGVFAGVIGAIFIKVFSDDIPKEHQTIVVAVFIGLLFVIVDYGRKIFKSKVALTVT